MYNTCLVLHMCASFFDYNASLEFWSNQPSEYVRIFGIDGCVNHSIPVPRIPYVQKVKPSHNRFKISNFERLQLLAVSKHLPNDCDFVVKLTGKYMLPTMMSVVKRISNRTLLALSSRGESYGGIASEVFGMNRALLIKMLALWTDGRNTESFVQRAYDIVSVIDATRVSRMPKMNTFGSAVRYSDKHHLKYL